jgi:hypothetical protein
VRSYRYDSARAGIAQRDGELQGWDFLLILLGLAGGGLGGYALVTLVGGWFGVSQPLTNLPLLLLWLFVLVAVPAGLVVGKRHVITRIRRESRRRAQAVAERLRLQTATTCQCWETATFADAFAHAYSHQHLVPAAPTQGGQTLAAKLGSGQQVLACPITATLWLRIVQQPDGALLLLRGNVPMPEPGSSAPSGFYL